MSWNVAPPNINFLNLVSKKVFPDISNPLRNQFLASSQGISPNANKPIFGLGKSNFCQHHYFGVTYLLNYSYHEINFFRRMSLFASGESFFDNLANGKRGVEKYFSDIFFYFFRRFWLSRKSQIFCMCSLKKKKMFLKI